MTQTVDRLLARTVESGPAGGLRVLRSHRCVPFNSGQYERPVQEFLQETLQPGDVFLDIGANVGFFTLLGARLVSPGGRVFAFEPIPSNIAVIHRNLAINRLHNVTVVPKAVSESVGRERIWVTDYPGGATLTSVGEVPHDAQRQIEVNRISLDSWMQETRLDALRLVKLDVEGAELAALRGMENLVSNLKPDLLIELDDPTRQGLECKADQIREWCRSVGCVLKQLPDAYANQAHQVMHLVGRPV